MKYIGVMVFSLFAGVISSSVADTLVEWDIANAGSEAEVIHFVEGSDATAITAHGIFPLNYKDYPGSFAAKDWDAGDFNSAKYYTFAVTAEEDDISLSGISLSLVRGDYGGGTGAENWKLCSSKDSYVNALTEFDLAGSDYNEQVAFSDDLDLIIAAGTSVEFRLYGYYESAASTDYSGLVNMTPGNYGIDVISGTGSNVKLYGTIPEPATLTLVALVGGACMGIRRIFMV